MKKVIFAAGLPASGKTSHLRASAQNELVYDGTINDEEKFIEWVQAALDMGYAVEVFVYSVDAKRAFESNLKRGDETGRYVSISHYEKVAQSINNRQALLDKRFPSRIRFRNFEHTHFQGRPKKFSNLIVNRHELESIARKHKFPDGRTLHKVIE